MDNFHIDVTAEGTDSLRRAIEIAMAHNSPGHKVESYHVLKLSHKPYENIPAEMDGKTALVLRWTNQGTGVDGGPVALPFKLDVGGAVDFASRWLAEQDYGQEPDHDGNNKKGWRIFVGSWGHVGSDRYAVCAIIPAWSMYGK